MSDLSEIIISVYEMRRYKTEYDARDYLDSGRYFFLFFYYYFYYYCKLLLRI